jgi:hypothetical protein
MGNYSARFGGGHLEKGRNAPRHVSTLQLWACEVLRDTPYRKLFFNKPLLRRVRWNERKSGF